MQEVTDSSSVTPTYLSLSKNSVYVVGKDLSLNEDDATTLKHLQQAVVDLYKRVHELEEDRDRLRSQVSRMEDL
jgi:hypothetical protein